MKYETNIHTFEFVHGFNSEQRFQQTYHGWMMLQQHDRCSSVQCRRTIKSHLIDNTNFLGKRWCLAFSMHYLMLAKLLDLYLWNVLIFRYDVCASQSCVNLTRGRFFHVSWEKKGGKVCIFSWNHDVWMFDILNQHDGMHHFSC